MRRLRYLSLLPGLGLACLLLAAAPTAHAATASVTPADTTVFLGSNFSIRVESDAFPDLKAYQLIFRYDSTVLQYLGATAGDVLTGTGQPYTVQQLPDVELPADTAGVDCASLIGSTSGPGVLIYFNFKAILVGTSPLACLTVDYRDSANNQTLPACVPGAIHVTIPVPTDRTTWGRVKTIYR